MEKSAITLYAYADEKSLLVQISVVVAAIQLSHSFSLDTS